MFPHPASFRDNSGFVFEQSGNFYRYVYPGYEMHYTRLMKSGLFDELVQSKKLIAHECIADPGAFGFNNGQVLQPQQIAFISYPYEWSFDMWKDAALLTLQIAMAALKKDMVLKDATPFNIQFVDGKPLFIDTLSFENYEAGKSWVAYHQFSQCFLGPLLLMHYCHSDSNKLFMVYPHGIPIDLLVNLLPKRSRWNINTFLHIHLQAKFSGKQKKRSGSESHFSRHKLELLLKGLEGFIRKLTPKKLKTAWDDYYTGTIMDDAYLQAKTTLVKSFIHYLDFKTVIDLGANDGHFSLLFNEDKQVIATDADSNCINHLYLKIKKEGRANILPLVNDLTTPSPAIGWANAERDSLTTRLKADLVLALALVHHLAIAGNVPFQKIAGWLQPMAQHLIVEFIPKTDAKVQLLLQNRKDIFDDYSLENFRSVFGAKYIIVREEKVGNTNRILFLMTCK